MRAKLEKRDNRMLKSLLYPLFTVLILTMGAGASAQTDAATAEALMRSSGLWKQLESVAPQMRVGLASAAPQGSPLPAAEIERISRISDGAFAAPRLRS